MIEVHQNKNDFEYDIHSLVRAFYPGVDVTVSCPEESGERKDARGESGERKDGREASGERKCNREEKPEEECSLRIFITYGDKEISISLEDHSEELQESCREEKYQKEGSRGEDSQWKNVHGGSITLGQDLERAETKNALKQLLYDLLSGYTGQKLPWGNLTGIRPTKIPMGLLEQGWKNTEIAAYMRDKYRCSSEKAALGIMIANRERHLLKEFDYARGYSLYVGIPFCPSICLYCSFSSSPISVWKDRVDDYLDALEKEIVFGGGAYRDKILDTVYIGGGTPTTLEPYQMDRLLTLLEQNFDYCHIKEFTVEAGRPDSITREKLEVLKAHGISRISINPQTMNQKTLDLIGRRHTVQETADAFSLARELGFDNINMDLIVGLPGEERPEVEHTMREVMAMDPDSITVHSLAVKRAARLSMFKDEYKELTFTNNMEIMDMTSRYAALRGLSPYYLYRQKNMAGNLENVGYAKTGKAGLYNILMMEEKQSILALGAGASTKIVYPDGRIERVENVKDIRNYVDRIDEMIDRKRSRL